MPRLKSILLHHWRAKLGSLVVAALMWLVLRHAVPPPPAASAPVADPDPTQPR